MGFKDIEKTMDMIENYISALELSKQMLFCKETDEYRNDSIDKLSIEFEELKKLLNAQNVFHVIYERVINISLAHFPEEEVAHCLKEILETSIKVFEGGAE